MRLLRSSVRMDNLGCTDEKRVAVEAIATLCYVTRPMVELLLKQPVFPKTCINRYFINEMRWTCVVEAELAPLILPGDTA